MRNKKAKHIFIGGLTPKHVISEAASNSKLPLQFAAENFQWSFISGLEDNLKSPVQILSAPFFPSYPTHHKLWYIQHSNFEHTPGSNDKLIGFINLPIIKNIFKLIGLFIGIKNNIQKNEKAYVFIYSTNLAYVAAAVLAKKFNKELVNCLIVTDLPEHPADCSIAYKIYLKYIEGPIFYKIIKYIDYFVTLTDNIPKALQINPSKCITIEGIFDLNDIVLSKTKSVNKTGKKIILYTGTLDKRYGADKLVSEFLKIKSSEIELWICGGGNCLDEIKSSAKLDGRIKYLGIKPRNEILELQSKSYLLINPRTNDGDYNKYSFPSKLMEYMASGTPVLAYKLDGVPDEYYDYIYTVNNHENEELHQAITRILTYDEIALQKMGLNAKKFILTNKNSKFQTMKILRFIGNTNTN